MSSHDGPIFEGSVCLPTQKRVAQAYVESHSLD
jgi:hypothetical protein